MSAYSLEVKGLTYIDNVATDEYLPRNNRFLNVIVEKVKLTHHQMISPKDTKLGLS